MSYWFGFKLALLDHIAVPHWRKPSTASRGAGCRTSRIQVAPRLCDQAAAKLCNVSLPTVFYYITFPGGGGTAGVTPRTFWAVLSRDACGQSNTRWQERSARAQLKGSETMEGAAHRVLHVSVGSILIYQLLLRYHTILVEMKTERRFAVVSHQEHRGR